MEKDRRHWNWGCENFVFNLVEHLSDECIVELEHAAILGQLKQARGQLTTFDPDRPYVDSNGEEDPMAEIGDRDDCHGLFVVRDEQVDENETDNDNDSDDEEDDEEDIEEEDNEDNSEEANVAGDEHGNEGGKKSKDGGEDPKGSVSNEGAVGKENKETSVDHPGAQAVIPLIPENLEQIVSSRRAASLKLV